jgi:hypothetical protein
MVSDEERREVARALRGDPTVTAIEQTRDGFEGMTYHEAAYRFWDMCRKVMSATNVDIAYGTCSVLADLIDPQERTCRNLHDAESYRWFECSECGCGLEVLNDEGISNIEDREGHFIDRPRYCPNCGARIVEAVDDEA